MRKLLSTTLAILLASAQTIFAQGAVPPLLPIGAAAAVAGGVTALAPKAGSAGRILSSGKTVFANDKISTDARGRLQVLFRDETVFTLGPDTEIVIDEFIYNPFDRSGEVLSTSVNKGTFRFVSGKVARKRPSAMKVKLPTGTIGIRGTIAGGAVLPDGSVLIALLGPGTNNTAGARPGSISVTNAGETVTISRPGFATIIRPGQPPTPPFKITPQQLAQLNTKPKAESGAGDPDGTAKDAKETGELGNSKSVADATGTKNAEDEDDAQSTTDAAQSADSVSDGDSSWDQVRNTSISGNGYYSTSGNYSCTGSGSCSTPGSGTLSTQVDVNFGTQQITNISFSLIGGPLAGQSTSLSSPVSFGTSGTATHTFQSGNLSNTNFANSQATFINDAGVAGQKLRVDLGFNNGSDTATGSTTGTYTPN